MQRGRHEAELQNAGLKAARQEGSSQPCSEGVLPALPQQLAALCGLQLAGGTATPNSPVALCRHGLETEPKRQSLPETSRGYSCLVLSLSPGGVSAVEIPLIGQRDKTPPLALESSSREPGLGGLGLSEGFLWSSFGTGIGVRERKAETLLFCCDE